MTSSFLPDINVWVALHHAAHRHHASAAAWFGALPLSDTLVFCRHTQIGLFRLLSTDAVMVGAPLTQRQCWSIYARWIDGGRAWLHPEPPGVDAAFQRLTSADAIAPKLWADAYLAAFAQTARLTLVTFDKALAEKSPGSLLLG